MCSVDSRTQTKQIKTKMSSPNNVYPEGYLIPKNVQGKGNIQTNIFKDVVCGIIFHQSIEFGTHYEKEKHNHTKLSTTGKIPKRTTCSSYQNIQSMLPILFGHCRITYPGLKQPPLVNNQITCLSTRTIPLAFQRNPNAQTPHIHNLPAIENQEPVKKMRGSQFRFKCLVLGSCQVVKRPLLSSNTKITISRCNSHRTLLNNSRW